MSRQTSIRQSIFVSTLFVLCLCVPATANAQQNDRIQLKLDTSEVKAVLEILDKKAAQQSITDTDWQALFASTPYLLLKARAQIFHGQIVEEDFKRFVLTLYAQRAAFHQALDSWEQADLHAAAEQTLQYLPPGAIIRASIYPVIKPSSNSFVFEASTNPAIFLYFDFSRSDSKRLLRRLAPRDQCQQMCKMSRRARSKRGARFSVEESDL